MSGARSGVTMVELLVASAVLVAVVVPMALLSSQGALETRASIDEFYGALYLAEVVEQVASLPPERLADAATDLDLTAPGAHPLVVGGTWPALRVSPMRSNFVSRSVSLRPAAGDGRALEVRGKVTYRRGGTAERTCELVTFVAWHGASAPGP